MAKAAMKLLGVAVTARVAGVGVGIGAGAVFDFAAENDRLISSRGFSCSFGKMGVEVMGLPRSDTLMV